MEAAAHASSPLSVLESVCCLACGEIYSKPVAGSTMHKNPGCPDCGYVGWIPLSLPLEARSSRRSGAGRRLRRPAQSD